MKCLSFAVLIAVSIPAVPGAFAAERADIIFLTPYQLYCSKVIGMRTHRPLCLVGAWMVIREYLVSHTADGPT